MMRVLIITDGMSAEEPAAEQTRRLADGGAVIDVILIDPADQG